MRLPPAHSVPAQWDNSDGVHLVWNVVYERSSRYAQCGMRIGANPIYECAKAADCQKCLAVDARQRAREGELSAAE